jgi:methylmalonyl-CoA epimerase
MKILTFLLAWIVPLLASSNLAPAASYPERYITLIVPRLAMYPVGQTYIELLESDGDNTETARWIAEHGEGLFHICLEVEDIEDALDELKRKGVKLIDEQPRIGHANSRIAFIDPKSTGNVVIELVELASPP